MYLIIWVWCAIGQIYIDGSWSRPLSWDPSFEILGEEESSWPLRTTSCTIFIQFFERDTTKANEEKSMDWSHRIWGVIGLWMMNRIWTFPIRFRSWIKIYFLLYFIYFTTETHVTQWFWIREISRILNFIFPKNVINCQLYVLHNNTLLKKVVWSSYFSF